jgi:hypothetical protein
MVTVISVVIAVFVTWIVAKVMVSRKWYETGRLCVIINERTGVQSLVKLRQPVYCDQDYAVVEHGQKFMHTRRLDSIRFYTLDGEVINEVNWKHCNPVLTPFSLLEDDDTMDQH